MKNLLQIILLPFALIYGAITYIRNKLYDFQFLNSKKTNIPSIGVGNLSVGGTGKTPHTEYLIELLSKDKQIVVLSRGYKRETKGFILANKNSTSKEIGDEPLQMKLKYPNINVAVSEDRVSGVEKISNKLPKTNLLLLDDVLQHRAINPGLKILITDFKNPFYNDFILPSGRLREFRTGYKRADIIIVSKCNKNIDKKTQSSVIKNIKPTNRQNVYFTYIKYGEVTPKTNIAKEINIKNISKYTVLLLSGISNPKPLKNYLEKITKNVIELEFSDHHNFSNTDINKIKKEYDLIKNENKIIITTEKDIMRLSLPEVFNKIQDLPIFYIPIKADFVDSESKKSFDKQILIYANSNK